MERKDAVTFKGAPLTLLGPDLKVGEKVPPFSVIDNGLKEIAYKDLGRNPKIISVTPSLDTPVCDAQARRFNVEAAKLPAEFQIINISMDLPFAIGRFCTSTGIDRVKTFSDYRHAYFGMAYGVMIKELRLLARAIFIIDSHDILRYKEVVPEMTHEVNYAAALAAAKKLLAGEAMP